VSKSSSGGGVGGGRRSRMTRGGEDMMIHIL